MCTCVGFLSIAAHADRTAVWWTIFPSIPGAINTWVSGDVAGSLLEGNGAKLNNWRWGFGESTSRGS